MRADIKILNDSRFKEWILDIKKRVRQSQLKAAVRVNKETFLLILFRCFIKSSTACWRFRSAVFSSMGTPYFNIYEVPNCR